MKVNRSSKAVTITFETEEELDIFWTTVEDAKMLYELDTPHINLLHELDSMLSFPIIEAQNNE